MDISAKESVKYENSSNKTSRKYRTLEKQNLQIIGIEEGEETLVKGTENIF